MSRQANVPLLEPTRPPSNRQPADDPPLTLPDQRVGCWKVLLAPPSRARTRRFDPFRRGYNPVNSCTPLANTLPWGVALSTPNTHRACVAVFTSRHATRHSTRLPTPSTLEVQHRHLHRFLFPCENAEKGQRPKPSTPNFGGGNDLLDVVQRSGGFSDPNSGCGSGGERDVREACSFTSTTATPQRRRSRCTRVLLLDFRNNSSRCEYIYLLHFPVCWVTSAACHKQCIKIWTLRVAAGFLHVGGTDLRDRHRAPSGNPRSHHNFSRSSLSGLEMNVHNCKW